MRSLACLLLVGTASYASCQGKEANRVAFTVTITALKPEFKLGEPAIIHIVMRCTNKDPIDVPEERHIGRGEMNYRITVTKTNGILIPDSEWTRKRKAGHAGGQYSLTEKELNYGDEIGEDADLNHVVNISEPGDYVLQVERADYKWGPSHIRSNRLTIHVAP